MPYYPSQRDIEMLFQSNKNVSYYINLLNLSYQFIDNIEGSFIDGNLSIDTESEIRRSCSLTFSNQDKNFAFGLEKKFWLDKLIELKIGVVDLIEQKEYIYPLGIFVVDTSALNFTGNEDTLTLSCLDLSHKLEMKLEGKSFIEGGISEGIPIRDALINFISRFSFIKKYRITDMSKNVPYKLEFSQDTIALDIIKELRDLYAGFETFFDVDGTFVCQPIPTTKNDEVILAKEQMSELVITESTEQQINQIKNIAQVIGKSLTADHYSEMTTGTGSTYTVTFAKSPNYQTGLTIAFKCNVDNLSSPKVIIEGKSYDLINDDGKNITSGTLKANTDYVFRFRGGKFYLQGRWQIAGVAMEFYKMPSQEKINEYYQRYNTRNIKFVINPDSPYSIEKIGELPEKYSSGIYDNIYSDDLALQRAEFELWKTTRMSEGLPLMTICIPWLNGNEKFEYTKKKTEETFQYITKKVDISLKEFTMAINNIRYYQLYPDIVSK